jgi:hypothetical protein
MSPSNGYKALIKIIAQRPVSEAARARFNAVTQSPFLKDKRDGHITDPVVQVAVVGGGFTGTTSANEIMRIAYATWSNDPESIPPVAVNLFERKAANFFGGIAYGQAGEHRLNIPRDRIPHMAGTVTFDDWAKKYHPDMSHCIDNSVPRSAYAEYLKFCLRG